MDKGFDEQLDILIKQVAGKAVNPLHEVSLIAEVLAGVASSMSAKEVVKPVNLGDNWLCAIPTGLTSEPKLIVDGKVSLENRELGGLYGMFEHINARPNLETIFCNDFSLFIQGFDAIAYDQQNDVYHICEAKGTTRPIASPLTYLKKTRRKGRQLSWEWCWRTLVDFALAGYTAPVFLNLYKRVLRNEGIARMLAVSKLNDEDEYFTLVETKVWYEQELADHAPLAESYALEKQLKWLEEIEVNGDDFKGLIENALKELDL